MLPPPRLRLLNAVQCLQALLTLQFTRDGYTQRIAALADLMPCPCTRDALRGLMHTLLARRIAAGFSADASALRRALEDVWADPLVLRRWQRLATALTEAQCEGVVHEGMRRGMAGAQVRWLPREVATEGWALESRATSGRPQRGTTPKRRSLQRRQLHHRTAPTVPRTRARAFRTIFDWGAASFPNLVLISEHIYSQPHSLRGYHSTVTDFAKLRGLSTSVPLATAV